MTPEKPQVAAQPRDERRRTWWPTWQQASGEPHRRLGRRTAVGTPALSGPADPAAGSPSALEVARSLDLSEMPRLLTAFRGA